MFRTSALIISVSFSRAITLGRFAFCLKQEIHEKEYRAGCLLCLTRIQFTKSEVESSLWDGMRNMLSVQLM